MELHGEKGTIIFDDSGFHQWKFSDSEEPMPIVEPRVSAKNDPTQISNDGHFVLVKDLIEAIREDRDPIIPGEEGRKSVDLILAIYESARTGKEVVVGQA